MQTINPLQIWQGFHWSFFINIQGLIISMLRFERSIGLEDFQAAKIELNTAAKLMLSAAASMELAGGFSQEEYDRYIRPTMMPPKVQSEDFSGLMFWDHAYLMVVWKKNQPIFKNMPHVLRSEQDEFIAAYIVLSQSHKKVCSKFGGNEISSLRGSKMTAIKTLNKFEQNRQKLISN
jgi:hypothetical protein